MGTAGGEVKPQKKRESKHEMSLTRQTWQPRYPDSITKFNGRDKSFKHDGVITNRKALVRGTLDVGHK